MEYILLSTAEAAALLGISRVAVFKKIKSGEIKARKVGRNFVIDRNELAPYLGGDLSKEAKATIDRAVKKTVREYGQTLKLLGRE